MENSVFLRGESECPGRRFGKNLFNLLVGLALCWGFGCNWIIAKTIPYETLAGLGPWISIIAAVIVAGLGVFIFTRYEKPLLSFIGYNLVFLSFGFLANLAFSRFWPSFYINVLQTVGLATGLMMFLSAALPVLVKRWWTALPLALLTLGIALCGERLWGDVQHSAGHLIFVVLICGYSGFNWGRANGIPTTLDNAIDAAASLYLDIIIVILKMLKPRAHSHYRRSFSRYYDEE